MRNPGGNDVNVMEMKYDRVEAEYNWVQAQHALEMSAPGNKEGEGASGGSEGAASTDGGANRSGSWDTQLMGAVNNIVPTHSPRGFRSSKAGSGATEKVASGGKKQRGTKASAKRR